MNARQKGAAFGLLGKGGVILAVVLSLLQGRAARADDRTEANQLVQEAQFTLRNLLCDDAMGGLRALLPKAEGVLIVPDLLKGAFFVGASGGNGVLLVRDRQSGTWSQPAFYTVAGGSYGFQLGGASSEVVLLAMTDRGVKTFLTHSFKLGADAGVAAGPVGLGASAATANLSADILSFSRSRGLYAGVALDGAVVAVRDDLNDAYYGRPTSTTDILLGHALRSPAGDTLASAVDRASRGSPNADQCAMRQGLAHPEGPQRLAGLAR